MNLRTTLDKRSLWQQRWGLLIAHRSRARLGQIGPSQPAFGAIVGRLDALDADKRPQGDRQFEEILTDVAAVVGDGDA